MLYLEELPNEFLVEIAQQCMTIIKKRADKNKNMMCFKCKSKHWGKCGKGKRKGTSIVYDR